MLWRLWGQRLIAAPVLAAIVVALSWGGLWALLFMCVFAVAATTIIRAGVADPLISHEQGHAARCHVRATWSRTMAGAGLLKNGVEPGIRGPIRMVEGGLWWKVRPAPGHDAAAWQLVAGPLCNEWKCSELDIRPALDRKGRPTQLLEVSCSLAGIMLAPVRWPYPPGQNPDWGRSRIPIGQFAGGRRATLDLDEVHVMVGGPPGAGKSVFIHTLLCALGMLPDEALVIFDLKGVDLEPWRPRAAAFCHQPGEARSVLAWLTGVMNARNEVMRVNNAKAAAGETAPSGRAYVHQAKWDPRPDAPHITVIIDEYAELPPDLFATWDRLARLGRAAGISLVTCTQRPAAELGEWFTRIRSNSIGRVALGAVGPEESRMILGSQHVPRQFVTLPKGCGRLVSGDAHGRSFRTYWSEPVMPDVAAASVVCRPALVMVEAVDAPGSDSG